MLNRVGAEIPEPAKNETAERSDSSHTIFGARNT
jgi:hypothetical protein